MGLVENLPECASTVHTTSPLHSPDAGTEALGWLGAGWGGAGSRSPKGLQGSPTGHAVDLCFLT